MTDTSPLDADASITDKMERIRSIIETLEDGEVSLERAKELRDEGRALLAEVEDDLDLGDSTIIENQ